MITPEILVSVYPTAGQVSENRILKVKVECRNYLQLLNFDLSNFTPDIRKGKDRYIKKNTLYRLNVTTGKD